MKGIRQVTRKRVGILMVLLSTGLFVLILTSLGVHAWLRLPETEKLIKHVIATAVCLSDFYLGLYLWKA